MKAEDILDDNFDSEYYMGGDYGDFAYPRETVIKAMEKYGEEVLKIAAQKAKIKRNYFPNEEALESQIERRDFNYGEYSYFISLESIVNCLKE